MKIRHLKAGMTALVNADDPTSAAREALLQEIAWDVVTGEPMSGVNAE